jgi:hypothetical protein
MIYNNKIQFFLYLLLLKNIKLIIISIQIIIIQIYEENIFLQLMFDFLHNYN